MLAALTLLTLAIGPLLLFGASSRDLTPVQEHELSEERDRALTLRALRERGGRLTAPPDGATRAMVEPAYPESRNSDGQAGSGGKAIAYRTGGRPEPSAAARELAPEALFWRTGFGSWEPTMGISPKTGTIFTSARNTNVDPGIARSKDGGKTWDRVTPPGIEASLDPYIWVDPATGSLFSSDIDAAPGICVPISRSDDDGDTWRTVRACGVTDHQNMFGGPPPKAGPRTQGYPSIVYYCAISGGTLSDTSTITECLKSLDGGATFTKTGTQPAYGPRPTPGGATAGSLCNGAAGHGVVGPDGTVFLPRAWCDDPYVAISRDQGATWKQVRIAEGLPAPEGSHETSIAADRDGNLYYVWVAGRDHHPYLSVSRDGGETWSAPKDIMPPGVATMSAFAAHVDVGDPGRIAAVFMGTEDPEVDEKTGWNAYMLQSVNALDADPTFYAAPANDPATNSLWKGECGDFRCGNIGDFMDIVVGPDGTASTALVDSCPLDEACTEFGVTAPRGEAVVGQLKGGLPLRGPLPSPPDKAQEPAAQPDRGQQPAAPPAGEPAPSCSPASALRSVSARSRGRGAVLAFERASGTGPVDVDVFQASSGRRVVKERLVARFKGRSSTFGWGGRARGGRRLADGDYFARFRTRDAAGRAEVRRITLRRSNGRFRARPAFYRRESCGLLSSFKLERPAFGGRGAGVPLRIAYRVTRAAQIRVTVSRGKRVVRRFATRQVTAGRTGRLVLPARGLPRGDYTVRLEAVEGGSTVRTSLVSRRL